jgi:hypothetical protein
MKPIVCLSLFLALAAGNSVVAAAPADYDARRAEGERLFAEGSYAKANEIYRAINPTNLPPAEARWVRFRTADTQWRSAASTQNADNTRLEQARQRLEELVRDIQRPEQRDRAWVEVQESLGDFWWTSRSNSRNWGQAWPHYQSALDWWAGITDLDTARERYLKIVWRIATPPGREPYYYYGYYGNQLPIELVENVIRIVRTDNDRAHAQYLLAMTLRNQGGNWNQMQRVPEAFENAIKPGKGTDWYDDALYHYAEWMANQGRVVPVKEGGYRQEPDYNKALEMFQRLVREFTKGETRYFDQANQQIKAITDTTLNVSVSHIFLPDSEIQYQFNWRNLKRVDFALYPVDLTRDVRLGEQNDRRRDWLQSIELANREILQRWSRDTGDRGDHVPGNLALHLDQKLKPGAYILAATGRVPAISSSSRTPRSSSKLPANSRWCISATPSPGRRSRTPPSGFGNVTMKVINGTGSRRRKKRARTELRSLISGVRATTRWSCLPAASPGIARPFPPGRVIPTGPKGIPGTFTLSPTGRHIAPAKASNGSMLSGATMALSMPRRAGR